MIAGVIGATGYAGAELVRLLAAHPKVTELALASVSFEGARIEDVYPNFMGKVTARLVKPEEAAAQADAVFAALPAGAGEAYAEACVGRGAPFIDLSADFRFGTDEALYQAWYGKGWAKPALREAAVYGLPELNRARIWEQAAAGRVIIGNPGCYPTGASLGAFPALARGLVDEGARVIVDSASGVTGGGREPARAFHYPECADSLAPYKVGCHRHSPEIARNFAAMAGRPVQVTFTPHLAPMNRGILSTIYLPLKREWQARPAGSACLPPGPEAAARAEAIHHLYKEFYAKEPFVRVLPAGVPAATGRVRMSNFCDISVTLDQSGTILIAASAIDNMVKGAAGQAVQNLNVIMGWDETSGLEAVPALF
ncbi:MAG: N-acetyl-gamma-glutamyl-phosphate reductase [Treponema sp.]|jgi:N-acetyl-gamma-glutamyl-phosphate reductase|nr:N-acetyl-gamma-glutamyl-phosphate reductase [Treponema sp.]